MARPLRIEYPDAVYHVMNRGLSRQMVFLSDQDCQTFLQLLQEVYRRWNVQIFAYALMGNHYHLCIQTPQGNLSRVMRHIDGVYTQKFNRTYKKDGPLFRSRYKAIVIDAEKYLGTVVRYIHLNPIKARMAEDPTSYNWSSHHEYLRRGPSYVKKEKLLDSMGGAHGFHEFVMQGNDELIEKYYSGKKQKPFLGDEAFVEKIKEKAPLLHNEATKSEKENFRLNFRELLKLIESKYKIKIEMDKRSKGNEVRQLAIYLAHEACDLSQQEVAKIFGLTYKTISWHCRKVRERLGDDKKFAKKVTNLLRRCN